MPRQKIKLSLEEKKTFFMARLRGESLRECAKRLSICYGTCQKIPQEKWYQALEKGTEAFVSAYLETMMEH